MCARSSPPTPPPPLLTHSLALVAGTTNRNTYLLSKKHFACTECGKCCTGAGVVWANRAELEAMRNAIDAGMSIEDFIAAYVDKDEMELRGVDVEKKEWFILKNADGKLNGTEYCVFLDPETNHCGES